MPRMTTWSPAFVICLALASAGTGTASERPTELPPDAIAPPPRPPERVRLEANRGQTDASVAYVARCGSYLAWIRPADVTLALPGPDGGGARDLLRLRLAGAAPQHAEPSEPMAGVSHYLTGRDESKWVRDVPSFGAAVFEDAWPGVAVRYLGSGADLRFDFEVAPGADASSISLAFDGARSLDVAPGGSLQVTTARGVVSLSAPVAFEEDAGTRRAVTARWAPRPGLRAGIDLEGRDPSRRLTIDPTVTYATFLGGTASETPGGMALDGSGNVVLAGSTTSADFPVTSGTLDTSYNAATDAYCAKFNSTATALIHATYLGGAGSDQNAAVALHPAGGLFLAGQTASADFPASVNAAEPTKTAAGTVGYVARLSALGNALDFATFVNYGPVVAAAADAAGSCVFAGNNASGSSPRACKLNLNGNAYAYSVARGASRDRAAALAVFPQDGSVVVTGTSDTTSGQFPTTGGAYRTTPAGAVDTFVWRLGPTGVTAYATLLGGSYADTPLALALDAAGNAYVAGMTTSPDFPLVRNIQQANGGLPFADAYVAKFDPTGAQLLFSTYIGGAADDRANAISVTSQAVFVGGETASTDFPVTAGAFQSFKSGAAGVTDGFLAVLRPQGLKSSISYYGGSAADSCVGAVAAAAADVLLHFRTSSANFPGLSAYDVTVNGQDAALVRITSVLAPNDIEPHALPAWTQGIAFSLQLSVTGGTGGSVFGLDQGSLPPGVTISQIGFLSGVPGASGTYTLAPFALDESNIGTERTYAWTINPPVTVPGIGLQTWTRDRPYVLDLEVAGGTAPYTWAKLSGALPQGLAMTSAGRVTGTPLANGQSSATVQVTDACGATAAGTIDISIIEPPHIDTVLQPAAATEDTVFDAVLEASDGTPPYTWSVVSGGTFPFTGNIHPVTGRLGPRTRAAGSYEFAIRATDAQGATATRTYQFVVNPRPVIDTAAFPPAAAGRPYVAAVAMHGGTPPFVWQAAFVPDTGLVFDAIAVAVTGVPTGKGTSSVQLTCTDASGALAAKSLPVEIAPLADVSKRKWSISETFGMGGPPLRRHALELVAGTSLSLVVKPQKGADPKAAVSLVDASGRTVSFGTAASLAGNVLQVKGFLVPATGRYFLVVGGTAGTVQTIALSAKVSLPNSFGGKLNVQAGAPAVDLPIPALGGSTLTISVKRSGKLGATPAIAGLLHDGADLISPGSVKGTTALSAKVTLPPGRATPRLLVGASDGTAGEVVWSVKVKQPKLYDAALADVASGD